MRAITSFVFVLLILFVVLPVLGKVLLLFLPGTEIDQLFEFFPRLIWQLIKQFMLEDKLKSFVIYFFIFLILNGLGIYISKKRENQVYEVIGFVLSIIGLASGSLI